ncbi:MAG: hypothetical protein N3D10_01355 [Candidatus Micrarchaeota archaeon]|nr:hypothetical protein [Candidatus Micrarchaeota archaeon]
MKKLFFLLVFFTLAFCYQLNISVFDPTGVKLVGTNISVYKGKELINFSQTSLYQKLGEKSLALASFDLEKGTYFIVIERGYYQPKVYLVELNSDQYLEAILIKESQSYTLYGSLKNYSNFEGKTLRLIDKNGKEAAKTKIYDQGYFLFSTLYPQTQYRIVLEDNEKKKFSQYFSYPTAGAYYLELDLQDEQQFQKKEIFFSSKKEVFVGEKISIVLKFGEQPLTNKTIIAILPTNQTINLTTDTYGIALLNAAQEGQYTFIYENYTTTTLAKKVIQTPLTEENKTTQQEQKEKSNQPEQNQTIFNKTTNQEFEKPIIQPKKTTAGELEILILFGLTTFISLVLLLLFYFLFSKNKK